MIILAALLIATPAIAAEECLKTEVEKYADTAQCLLWVDGKLVTGNDSCKVVISGNMRSFAIKDVAEVSSRPKTKLPALGFELRVTYLVHPGDDHFPSSPQILALSCWGGYSGRVTYLVQGYLPGAPRGFSMAPTPGSTILIFRSKFLAFFL